MTGNHKPPVDKPEMETPVQAHLGEHLRRYFSSIVAEPVPDRFANLLDELEKKERAAAKPDGEHGR